MFSNLKTAFQNITSKDKNEDEYEGEDIQAVIILLLEACQIDGDTGKVELEYIKKLLACVLIASVFNQRYFNYIRQIHSYDLVKIYTLLSKKSTRHDLLRELIAGYLSDYTVLFCWLLKL